MASRTIIDPGVLRRVAIFRTLDDQQLLKIGALLKERRFRRGDIIFHQGDSGGCLYIIKSGRVRIYLTSEDGREITFRLYGPGTTFGEFSVLDNGPRSASASALTEATTFVLYRDDLLQLMREHFGLVEHIIAMLTERLRYTTSYSAQLAFLSVPGRVAAILMQLASAELSDDPVRLDLTQQELATFASTTREWVNRALRDFADLGIVRLERGAVIVLDPSSLRARIN